jgi:hypothetical protein
MIPSNWRFWGLAASMGILSVLGGCAAVSQGLDQPMRVDVLSQTGEVIPDARCRAVNDKAKVRMRSGRVIGVRRSRADLVIQCSVDGQGVATGQAISRPNIGFLGNFVIAGGVIGAAVDDSAGTAYTYPTWIQMVIGEERLYDRSGHRDESLDTGTLVRKIDPGVAVASRWSRRPAEPQRPARSPATAEIGQIGQFFI